MALEQAPEGGLTVPELIDRTGMGRTWVYERLQALAADGRAPTGRPRALASLTRIVRADVRPLARVCAYQRADG